MTHYPLFGSGLPWKFFCWRICLWACHTGGMPKRISRKRYRDRRPQDVNQLARYLVDRSTEDSGLERKTTGQQLSPEEQERQAIKRIMSEMGRRGGKIGGKRRLETMSPEQGPRFCL